jgi:hypothetical protein
MPFGFPIYLNFVPMLWGNQPSNTANFVNNANNALSCGATHILSFNEPDSCGSGGSCMSPQDTVNAYRQYIMPFAGRAQLGAPAVTNGAGGLPWLRQFLSLCTGCQIDFVPIHWYDSATNEAYFYSYFTSAQQVTGGRHLWLTEVGVAPV